MNHYDYLKTLETLWKKGVERYQSGIRGASEIFDQTDQAFLSANGVTRQEIYDFCEDFVSGGEPDFATFVAVTDVRRHYFFEMLHATPAEQTVDPASYPPKDAEIDGIVWLPRIIEKAKAKLRGQLDDDTMYGCGGDRRFFREHDFHPAQFLRVVETYENDDAAIINWVKSHSAAINQLA